MPLDEARLRSLPKTDLHCHLDGSLRIDTLLELADEAGFKLPTRDRKALEATIVPQAGSSLEDYLTRFKMTLGALQTAPALSRAAYELAEDAHREGVWYLEVRYAPFLHREKGLNDEEIVAAVLDGLGRAREDFGIQSGVILCALRTDSPKATDDLAELAIRFRGQGVVALDLAGAEDGFPAAEHQAAFQRVRSADMHVTVHAGESFGAASIRQAIHDCGAERIGHGTRLVDDDSLLQYVDDRRIGVEVCLSSNLQTGSVSSLKEHPLARFLAQGVRVSLNTDNRLMSDTTVTGELMIAVQTFGLSTREVERLVLNGFKSAFLSRRDRAELLERAGTRLRELLDAPES